MQALDDDSGLARPVDLVADVARGPAAYALEVVEISGERAPLDVEETDGELSRPEVAAFREELKELTLVLRDARETQSDAAGGSDRLQCVQQGPAMSGG